jgi:hypothetical protein
LRCLRCFRLRLLSPLPRDELALLDLLLRFLRLRRFLRLLDCDSDSVSNSDDDSDDDDLAPDRPRSPPFLSRLRPRSPPFLSRLRLRLWSPPFLSRLRLRSPRPSRLRRRLRAAFRSRLSSRSRPRLSSRSRSRLFFSASSSWYLSTIERLPHDSVTPGYPPRFPSLATAGRMWSMATSAMCCSG